MLAHAALLAGLFWLGSEGALVPTLDLGAGEGRLEAEAGGGGGGGGGERVTFFKIPTPAPASLAATVPPELVLVQPVPEPVPEPPAESVEETPVAPPSTPTPSEPRVLGVGTGGSGTGGGVGSGVGPGTGPGTGPGSGGGSGGGTGGGVGSGNGPTAGVGEAFPPEPEVLLIPPPAPRQLRGRTLIVRLAVDARGAVGEVELVPPSGDRKFDNAVRRTARDWRFRPARDPSGRPIAGVFDVTFTF